MLQLTVMSGPCAGASLTLQGRQAVIGRDAGCALCLADDATVSRQHSAVAWEAGQWLLRDLGSKNGTSLEGPGGPEPVQSPQPLVPGLVFLVGSARVRVTAVPMEEAVTDHAVRLCPVGALLPKRPAALVPLGKRTYAEESIAAVELRRHAARKEPGQP